jgi:hypothetical protein
VPVCPARNSGTFVATLGSVIRPSPAIVICQPAAAIEKNPAWPTMRAARTTTPPSMILGRVARGWSEGVQLRADRRLYLLTPSCWATKASERVVRPCSSARMPG